jgi:hypothetical protein
MAADPGAMVYAPAKPSNNKASDLLRMDLKACYPVAALERLERQWTYRREGRGSLVIERKWRVPGDNLRSSATLRIGVLQVLRPPPECAWGSKVSGLDRCTLAPSAGRGGRPPTHRSSCPTRAGP